MTRLGKHLLVLFVGGLLMLAGDLPTTTASPGDSSTPSINQKLLAQKKGKKGGKKGKKGKNGGGGMMFRTLPRRFVPGRFAGSTWSWNNGIVGF